MCCIAVFVCFTRGLITPCPIRFDFGICIIFLIWLVFNFYIIVTSRTSPFSRIAHLPISMSLATLPRLQYYTINYFVRLMPIIGVSNKGISRVELFNILGNWKKGGCRRPKLDKKRLN